MEQQGPKQISFNITAPKNISIAEKEVDREHMMTSMKAWLCKLFRGQRLNLIILKGKNCNILSAAQEIKMINYNTMVSSITSMVEKVAALLSILPKNQKTKYIKEELILTFKMPN